MNNWFECKVTYDRTGEDGMIKKVTEPYMVDALSFTEAESRICKECQAYATGEFTVSAVKRCKIAEMFFNEDLQEYKWFRCRVNYVSLDEEKGVEKRIAQTMMVQAVDFQDAVNALVKGMNSSVCDYEIASITETKIIDVYKYEAPEVKA
jgi:mannosyltransferase OCH1-like enzyme